MIDKRFDLAQNDGRWFNIIKLLELEFQMLKINWILMMGSESGKVTQQY